MFSEEIKRYSWDETTERIRSKTGEDVRRALSKQKCDTDDFMALISPAAEPYLETMARLSRKYTREQYIALVNRIREACPDISLSTDILIGFPGETESDLEETLSLMETVKFEYAYMYHYNPREGTKAFELPNRIPEPEKIRRLDKVIKLQHKITGEVLKNRLYREVPVLVESVSRDNPRELLGRTGRDSRVVFKGPKDLIGDFVNVRLEEIKGFTYRGTLMEN